jgi:hypothetical protein
MTRRSHTRQLLALILVAALPLAAAQAGCATGSGDDTSQSSGIPTGSSTTLAPGSSSPSGSSTNANTYGYMGDASSAGGGGTDSAATSPSSSFDAAAPPSGPVGACDTSNPKYYLELFTTPDAGTCPCSASECCFSGLLVCLPE